MTQHLHSVFEPSCYRCVLSRDEWADQVNTCAAGGHRDVGDGACDCGTTVTDRKLWYGE